MKGSGILFFLLFFTGLLKADAQPASAPDSVSMTLADAESLFLQKNFQLLAAKYEVSAADAAIIQTKLYPNPNLSFDQGVYNQDTKKWFDFTGTGETALSLEQVILLAGKRNKQINIAKINSEISKYQFYDLIRTLRYELHTSFYGLYFLRQSIAVYDKEIESLRSLINVYTTQYNEGNIAFKELARLQALQFGLENERVDLLKDASDKQSNLILLTGDTLAKPIKPISDSTFINQIDAGKLIFSQLVDSALTNRFDLQATNAQVKLNQSNLALQKAMGVPDLTLGANYDKAGSYVRNYNSLSLAIDLPLWNRNQGNIKIARFQIDESRQLLAQKSLEVQNDLRMAYSRLLDTDKLFKSASSQFNSNYEKLLEGITLGYQNRTISLLEFIDYYETYKDSKIEFNRLQNNRLEAMENLNLATGTTNFK